LVYEIKCSLYDTLQEEFVELKAQLEKETSKGKKRGDAKKAKKPKPVAVELATVANTQQILPLFEEIKFMNIIQNPGNYSFSDFIGQRCLMKDTGDIGFCLGDLRRIITETCCFPLLSDTDLLKFPYTFLFYGRKGSGKKMLVSIIARSTGATLFNISPRNLGSLSNGKVITTVFKLAKLYAPSIIFMEDTDCVFSKKMPKDFEFDPRKSKKDFIKACKSLKPADRVIVIGSAERPWESDYKGLTSNFERHIFVINPEYGSMLEIWKEAFKKSAPECNRLPSIPPLARASQGRSAGDIFKIVGSVMTTQRKKKLNEVPLQSFEFLKEIVSLGPIKPEERTFLKEWYTKTNSKKE
jgi:SpoVK/Ycf46/Vps4 family AAA+-type ATPase